MKHVTGKPVDRNGFGTGHV